jgi:TRAP-type C4-dicarboxylate transport system permease small subunit
MPPLVHEIFDIVAQLLRFVGMIVLGFATARLALEFFRKGQPSWQVPAIIFFSFALLIVGLTNFGSAATLAGFALGAGAGLLAGLGGPKKEEKIEA